MRVGLRVSSLSCAHVLITCAQTLTPAYAGTRASTRGSLSPSVLACSASLATCTFIACVVSLADKGSVTVILNFDDYVKEAEHQLSNSDYYLLLKDDPTSTFTAEINNFQHQMKEHNSIDESSLMFLHSSDTRPARFYLLPKLHKERNPGRPIISSNNAPTEKYHSLLTTTFALWWR